MRPIDFMRDYVTRDRAVWEGLFARMPAEWYDAPPSDAMLRCRSYLQSHPCTRVLDLGCGFGRWAQFLAGSGVQEIVGLDYAERGIRAARMWAQRARFNARFVVGSATDLPFRDQAFDGVLAALVLDGLSRADCGRAVRSLTAVVRPGGRGFFVFNPVMTPAELAEVPDDNPTRGCMHVTYEDRELATLLTGWLITGTSRSAEGLRLIEGTRSDEDVSAAHPRSGGRRPSTR